MELTESKQAEGPPKERTKRGGGGGSFLHGSGIRTVRGGTNTGERLKYKGKLSLGVVYIYMTISGIAGVAQRSPVKTMKTPAARIFARMRLVKVV